MSNSSLVEYVCLSPNKTSPRNHKIDTITIHCTAGQLSIESLGNIFKTPDRKASSNYGVDKDGRIGLFVDEADRSWCSSNKDNDMRAITIEVSSDNFHPYKVTDNVYNRLIELVCDICYRNNITKLVWSNNKNDRINHLNGCNMTVHRDYANKACPGDYLYNLIGDIAEKVNKMLDTTDNIVTTKIRKNMTNSEIYSWFLNKGLTSEGVCGLLGNLYAESGIRSNNLQNSYENKLGYNDETYTDAVNNGNYTKEMFVHDKAGYGLAQWTFHTRKENLYNFAVEKNHYIDSTEMQVEFLYKELETSYKSVLQVLKTSNDLKVCSDIVLIQFEKPKDQSDNVKDKRYNYSKQIYDKFNKSSDTYNCPFRIRVEINNLNIRKGPGTNYDKVEKIPVGVFTITEVQNNNWGKLKSNAGWICLDYVKIL